MSAKKKPKLTECPCPGCGKTSGLWVERNPAFHADLQYVVICICGWEGPSKATKKKAIEAWEKRVEG